MNEVTTGGRRRGGREARRELRAAPLAEDKRAVRPGLQGGRYKPLTNVEVSRIHQAALDVLEQIGLADTLGGISQCFTLHGQDPKHDFEPCGKKVHFGTAGAAVHMVDAITGAYRDSTVADLYDIARLVDTLDHIHFFQRPIVCRDLEDPREMDFNTCYACVAGTSKHIGTSFVLPEHAEEALSMLHEVAGGEDKWRARPFVSASCCFVVPPLKFAQDACHTMEALVRGGMPVLLLAAGQAGATSPAAPAAASRPC
jgi:trimethylamine--corrinoid protein Co-methyltransferase